MTDFIDLLHKHDIDYEPVDSEEVRMPCPECADDSGHFYVNTVKQVGYCQKCGFSPSRVRLHRALFDEAPPQHERARIRARKIEKTKAEIEEIKLPLFWKEIPPDHPYMIKRRINRDTIRAYNLGYCDVGDYAQCLIIPTYMCGKLVNYIARDMTGKRDPKYLYPKGVKQAHCLFNYDRAKNHSSLIVVEGALDAMRVGFNTVALGRKKLSKRQLEFIQDMKARSVFVMLDGDAIMDALNLCEQLAQIKPTYLCNLPPEKDPDDLGASVLGTVLSDAEFYSKALRARVSALQAVL